MVEQTAKLGRRQFFSKGFSSASSGSTIDSGINIAGNPLDCIMGILNKVNEFKLTVKISRKILTDSQKQGFWAILVGIVPPSPRIGRA